MSPGDPRAEYYQHQNPEKTIFLDQIVFVCYRGSIIGWKTDTFSDPTNINNRRKNQYQDPIFVIKRAIKNTQVTKKSVF